MKEIKKILVPVDFSNNSPKLLDAAVYLAKNFNARLEVVYVVESLDNYSGFAVPHISLENFEQELREAAERKMEAFLEDNLEEGIAHDARILSGDVPAEITRHAKDAGCDLIVIATHGYKGLEKALFGSVAERVVKTAPCPVLTINPYQ